MMSVQNDAFANVRCACQYVQKIICRLNFHALYGMMRIIVLGCMLFPKSRKKEGIAENLFLSSPSLFDSEKS